MFYIIDSRGQLVSTSSVAVDARDLAARGETAVHSDLSILPGQHVVTGFPANPQISAGQSAPVTLALVVSATDSDGDGVPDIPADGKSKTTLTAKLTGPDGKPANAAIQVTFRTTGGALAARSATAQNGEASVGFTASRETVSVSLSASIPGADPAYASLEMIPKLAATDA
jgi:hypothetical protein